jgi:hypothetical protein
MATKTDTTPGARPAVAAQPRDASGESHPDARLLADVAAVEAARRAFTACRSAADYDAYFAERATRDATDVAVAVTAPATWVGLRAKSDLALASWRETAEGFDKYFWCYAALAAALEEATTVLRILDEDGADMGYAFAAARTSIQGRRTCTAAVAARIDHPASASRAWHPDAALIAACDEFTDIARRLAALPGADLSEEAREGASEAFLGRQSVLIDAVCDMGAATLEGLQARGRMMAAYQGTAAEFPHGPWPEAMIGALLRDLTEGGEAPADRDLLALAGELAERVKVEKAAWAAAKGEGPNGPRTWAAEAEETITESLVDRIARTRAVGLPGLLAKFRAIMWCSDNVPVTEGSGTTQERVIASLCADLGAMEADWGA